LLKSFERTLRESGTIATGKSLHFAIDIVCSGAFNILIPILWNHAINHVGIASPRIIVYLQKRLQEIKAMMQRLPDEIAYANEEFQIRVGELILVLRDAPTRSTTQWPKVGPETHNEGWLKAAASATETAALRKVWQSGDTAVLRTAGSELCKAITDGSTEKALFWIRWMFEEEVRLKKEIKGASLTTVDRGGKKGGVGSFILTLFGEIYKELAAKELVRMHEEFQALMNLWRSESGSKRQILVLLTQILCEVPRWKVPAAPALIKDPVAMSRAIREVPKFFREVLAYDPANIHMKSFKAKVEKKVVKVVETQNDAFDRALEAYFSRM
jgi:hypothetical protein